MTPAERAFEAAAELGRIIAEQRQARRQDQKDARNARRRARYAATKHLPRPAKAAAVLPGDEFGDPDQWEPVCTCYRSAPCHYCTTTDMDARTEPT